MAYRPKEPFTTPCVLYHPATVTVAGVTKKAWSEVGVIFCSFKTYGGTDTVSNGQLVVQDTATVETWYRPDIKSDCKLVLNGKSYEIIGEPENIEQRNQFIKFKVSAVRGGV